MPTTWWIYGLYGLIELARPHWFGWWTVVLILCIAVLLWLLTHKTVSQEDTQPKVPVRNRSAEFESATTLEWTTKLMLERSWTYKVTIPLWVTLLALQNKPRWSSHKKLLIQLESTLYDESYEAWIDCEALKLYLLDHKFFDWLTTSWIVK
jgi:hypothetical protein